MKKLIALSVLGSDRPGIVAAISKVFYQTGCNIADSSMTQLRGEFAMILMVELPAALSIEALKKAFIPVSKLLELSIAIRVLKSTENVSKKQTGIPYMISLYGADKPGIVYKVSAFLAKSKINITDVQTNITQGKKYPVYIMMIEAVAPKNISEKGLSRSLSALAKKLSVTLSCRPIEAPEL